MTQKQAENVFLTECTICGGEGVVEMGQYDDHYLATCICKLEEKADKDAEGLEGANIDADYHLA